MSVPPPNYPPEQPPGKPPDPPSGAPPLPVGGPPGPEPRRPGRLLGGVAALGYIVLLLVVSGQVSQPFGVLVYGLLLGVAGATIAIVTERFRPYAVGFLLGLGIVSIVAGGVCIGFLALLTSMH